ncbi:hypothetical protein BGZ65_004363 [Modicella reniformis]|uniref:Stc1 domain-containing protein n=1 Tax=Modicella reniformis TaxID=1440133 RepID=A0A9P6J5N9_9FUNG|nr:hypothetical protein BGZ65_004363 [Modicella reniformis]
MSGYKQRPTNTAGRAPNPANNRQFLTNGNSLYCYGCEKNKPRLAFTETQLKKYGSNNPKKEHQIMCKECTPTQATTLKCNSCSKTLPLEDFSKTQRKRQERATCMECRRYHEDDDSGEELELDDDPDWHDDDIDELL